MPYVPSGKTDPPAQDRHIIDAALEPVALSIAKEITNNLSLIHCYRKLLENLAHALYCNRVVFSNPHLTDTNKLAKAIFDDAAAKYGYEGAFLGELNYALTRLIQRVPQIMVEQGTWKEEMKYWMWPATIEAFMLAADKYKDLKQGISGVFLDVILEYKRRVNTAYEAAQILKSGDCYDTPYYTRLVEVVDETGTLVGHQEVFLKRDEKTLCQDLLDYQIVMRKRT